MHVFRRLNVTWRQQAGATPVEAQKAAGHASLDMTMLYTQTEEEREREHVEKIMERLGMPTKKASVEGLRQMKTTAAYNNRGANGHGLGTSHSA